MEMTERKCCQNCGEELIVGANFCSKCGTKVEQERKCVSCGTILSIDERFCHMCGERCVELDEKENTNTIMQSVEKTLSDDEKRHQILKRIESTNSTVVKDVGENFYFVCVKDSTGSLVLYDLRDVSDVDLNKDDFRFMADLTIHNEIFSTMNDVWMGTADNGKIYYIEKQQSDSWVLHRIDLAELEKCGRENYTIEEVRVNKSGTGYEDLEKPDIIKCEDDSIRIVYKPSCGGRGEHIILNSEGKEIWHVTSAQNKALVYLYNQYFMLDLYNDDGRYSGMGLFDAATGEEIIPCDYDRIFVYEGKETDRLLFIPLKGYGDGERVYERQDVFCLIENNMVRKLSKMEMLEIEPLITKVDYEGRVDGKLSKAFAFKRVPDVRISNQPDELKFCTRK